MMISRFVFGLLIVGCMGYFLVLRRRSPLSKLFVFLVFGAGLVFVTFPEIANALALLVGIGRGADLVLYLSIVFLLFLFLSLYIRVLESEDRLAELTRELAIRFPIAEEDRDR